MNTFTDKEIEEALDIVDRHRIELKNAQKEMAHWKQRFNDIVEENCMLRAELDELRSKE